MIHPGSGSPAKNWPLDSFIDVARLLQKSGREVSFVIGDVERERVSAAELQLLRTTAPVIEPADCVVLRAAMWKADSFVGNDSGPTHLAAVLGLRTVAIFGPASSIEQWKPAGPRVTVATFADAPDAVVQKILGD